MPADTKNYACNQAEMSFRLNHAYGLAFVNYQNSLGEALHKSLAFHLKKISVENKITRQELPLPFRNEVANYR